MSAYYFFTASLPMLKPGAPPPFSRNHLRDMALEHLRTGHARALHALLDDTPHPHPFVRAWQAGETQLCNAVAHRRARRGQSHDAALTMRPHEGYRVDIDQGVEAAFQQPDPLRREHALDALRWQTADTLCIHDPFGETAIFAYAVKLALLEKQAAVDPEAGRTRVTALLDEALATTDPPSA